MALGIACAGTGQREAIALLEPMVKFDPVNFVRQGALIASAMILIQQTDQTCPKVSFFRTLYAQVISNKHEDVIAKYGAILAQGIIDAGGRNVTLSLQSRTGHTNMLAVVGTLVFTQYWYWFPLAHCLALAFTPTCLIALNKQLKMPKLELRSNSKPSLYAYPAPLEEKKREEREKVTTAVLSIAARARKRDSAQTSRNLAATSAIASTASTPNVSSTATTPAATTANILEKMEIDEEPAKEDKEKDKKSTEEKKPIEKKLSTEDVSTTKKEQEPTFEILNNPARCLRQQLKNVSLVDGSSYSPMKDVSIGGIIMMHHLRSDEEQLVEPVAAFGPKTDDEKEPEAPEPFEWSEE